MFGALARVFDFAPDEDEALAAWRRAEMPGVEANHGPVSVIPRIGQASVEELQTRIGSLVRQRQELRAAGASADRLEGNRRQLVRTQWTLSAALIARHGKKTQRQRVGEHLLPRRQARFLFADRVDDANGLHPEH